jgi:hypothetical protein
MDGLQCFQAGAGQLEGFLLTLEQALLRRRKWLQPVALKVKTCIHRHNFNTVGVHLQTGYLHNMWRIAMGQKGQQQVLMVRP